jgi:hypothetical protein
LVIAPLLSKLFRAGIIMPEREVRFLARWMLAVPDFQECADGMEPEAQIGQVPVQSADRRVIANCREGSLVIEHITVRYVRRYGTAIGHFGVLFACPRPIGEIAVQHLLQSGNELRIGQARRRPRHIGEMVPVCLWRLEHDINPVLNGPHHCRPRLSRNIDALFLAVPPPVLGEDLRPESDAHRIVRIGTFQQGREEGITARCADRILQPTIFIALSLTLRPAPRAAVTQVHFAQRE